MPSNNCFIVVDDKVKVKAEPDNDDKPNILKKKLLSPTNGNKKVPTKKIKEESLPPVSENIL